MSGKPQTIRAELMFKCPFCKGQVSASLEPPCLLHAVPMCKKFDELEPDEFMHECNEIFAKNAAN